jgi:ribosomal protein L7/L12
MNMATRAAHNEQKTLTGRQVDAEDAQNWEDCVLFLHELKALSRMERIGPTIKLVRQITGLNLLGAKNFVEKYIRDPLWID